MPEDGKAMAFARRHPGRVFVAFFPNMASWKHRDAALWKPNEPVVLIHRTRALDDLFARFVQQLEHLPQGSGFIPGFRAHLKAPVRVVSTDGNGNPVARYDEGSAADHYTFALLYSRAAWHAVRGAVGTHTPYSVGTGAVSISVPVKRLDETEHEFAGREAVYAAEASLLAARKKIATLTADSRRRPSIWAR
jgi:hypothetical protein